MPSKSEERLLIPLRPDYDPADVQYIKHSRKETINGVEEYEEESVPRLSDDASPYYCLEFFASFARTRRNFQWTNGPRLFRKFGAHLNGTFNTDWLSQIEDLDDPDRTVERFDTELNTLKTSALQGYHYDDQIEHLRALKKPLGMKPSEFGRLLKNANNMAKQLPDVPADAGFSDSERKRVFFNAMPQAWQKNFKNAGKTLANSSITEIQTYMDTQADLNPPMKDKKKSSGGNNSSNDSSRSRGCT